MEPFRSGYVAILGRPNVGKSTFLNRVLGEKISIVSEKPQTTRNRIVGIHNQPEGDNALRAGRGSAPGPPAQVIFLDTPGIHRGRDSFNKWMVDQALSTLSEVDVALFVVEANNSPGPGDRGVYEAIAKSKVPCVLAANKIDLVPENLREKKLAAYRALGKFTAEYSLSAQSGENVEALLATLVSMLPEGPQYFPDDQLTDLPERFIAAELVREKVFLLTRQEIPYSVAVVTEEFIEAAKEGDAVHIECTMFVERESQKGMLIGKGGSMLKEIGIAARKDLEKLLATKVVLKLWVKVKSDWSRDPRMLDALGYSNRGRE